MDISGCYELDREHQPSMKHALVAVYTLYYRERSVPEA
jgi:hypothetical protein